MPLPTLDGGNEKEKKDGKSGSLPSFNMPKIDDDFQSVPVNEALYGKENDEEENGEVYTEVERQKEENVLPKVEENEDSFKRTEHDYNPDYEEDLKRQEEEEDKFIDKKKKKIVPFGGKKSKKKNLVKSSDFDDRKNKLAKTKVIQFTILAVIFIMFLLGLKNTFLPAHVYTDEQIKSFAAQGAGQTGFPAERGEAFVESFLSAYLTIDSERPDYNEVLRYFYGSTDNGSVGITNMETSVQVKQKIIIEPTVFERELLSSYAAQYKASAYVTDIQGKQVDESKTAVGRWVSFSINVYYDKENDTLSITQDSPSIIPSYKIASQNDVPALLPLGNGTLNRDVEAALTPTINGFIEAYAKSSLDSHESIIQYIDDKNNPSLIGGFGGSVRLKGEPNSSIKKAIYNADDGSYRVDLTVTWEDATSQEDLAIEYTSRYMMKVISISEGKYAVSSFEPMTYFKK